MKATLWLVLKPLKSLFKHGINLKIFFIWARVLVYKFYKIVAMHYISAVILVLDDKTGWITLPFFFYSSKNPIKCKIEFVIHWKSCLKINYIFKKYILA